jgi:hypothetical protein
MSSQYVGVNLMAGAGYKNKWRAQIGGTDPLSIGFFATEIEAAKAYDKICLERRGEFAVLNFPKK